MDRDNTLILAAAIRATMLNMAPLIAPKGAPPMTPMEFKSAFREAYIEIAVPAVREPAAVVEFSLW